MSRGRREPRQNQDKLEATRGAIQHEYIRLLSEAGFSFQVGDKEPRGVQAQVVKNVNKIRYGDETLITHHAQVRRWVERARNNNWRVTDPKTDYSTTSQNSRKFFDAEQKRIRHQIRDNKLKSDQLPTVWSDEKQKMITVSATSARRYLKRKYPDEPSMLPAKLKGSRGRHNTSRSMSITRGATSEDERTGLCEWNVPRRRVENEIQGAEKQVN